MAGVIALGKKERGAIPEPFDIKRLGDSRKFQVKPRPEKQDLQHSLHLNQIREKDDLQRRSHLLRR